MDIGLWIVQVLLLVMFGMVGMMKAFQIRQSASKSTDDLGT